MFIRDITGRMTFLLIRLRLNEDRGSQNCSRMDVDRGVSDVSDLGHSGDEFPAKWERP